MLPSTPIPSPLGAQSRSLGRRCYPHPSTHSATGAATPQRRSAAAAATASTTTSATTTVASNCRNTNCGTWGCSIIPVANSGRRDSGAAGPLCARGRGGVVAAADTAAAADTPRVEEPSTALLLAWFACGNRSLFAAQCLVEVLVELYREGRTFGELQLSLKMATQGGRVRRPSAAGSNSDREVLVAGAIGSDGGDGGATGSSGEEGEEEVLTPLLQGQEEDVLVSWVALVFLTCEELGVPRDKEPPEQRLQRQQQQQREKEEAQQQAGQATTGRGGGGAGVGGLAGSSGSSSMAAGSVYLRGMLGYVRQTLGMYDEGQTLARVAGLQGLVQQSSGAASSPFLVLMQQYTRLVLLTVEVVAAAGAPTARPLRPPETVTRPSGYSRAFTSSCSSAVLFVEEDGDKKPQGVEEEGACPARGLAVRLLMSFMGAVLGSSWSLGKFVEAVRVAYDQGLAADELFQQLDEQEFVQSGGLLPIASGGGGASAAAAAETPSSSSASDAGAVQLPAVQPQYQITKALLSTWISLSYMTLAQLAVPYPEAGQRLGWAWAGFGDPIEALGMNDFVGNVLRQMAGTDPRVVPQPPQPPPPSPLEQLQQQQAEEEGPDVGPDVAQPSDQSTAAAGDRRRAGALMVRVEDTTLPNTSTAVRVMTQQIALVQAVCRMVMTEGQD